MTEWKIGSRFVGRANSLLLAAILAPILGWVCHSSVSANEFAFHIEDYESPQMSLRKSPDPWQLMEHYLEAGDMVFVEEFLKDLRLPRDSTLSGKTAGLLELYRGNYTAALEALVNVSSRDEWTMTQEKYLRGLIAASEGFQESTSEHFRLRTKSEDAFLGQYALRTLENAFSKMSEVFQTVPTTSVIVEIYPTEARFSEASTLISDTLERSGAIGICKFHRLMILSPQAAPLGYRWLDAIAHEYNHYLVNQLSGALCPLWLHEGVARCYETSWRRAGPFEQSPAEETKLAEAALADSTTAPMLIPFRKMEPSLVYLKDQDEVALAFAEVSDAVAYLVEQQGADKLRELLSSFRRFPRAEAFEKVLGMTEEEFEISWKESLRDRKWRISKGAMKQSIHLAPVDEIEFVGADAQGHIRLGDRLRQQGQLGAALLQYRKALEQEPDNGVALVKLARTYSSMGNQESVEAPLRRAVEKNPSYMTAFVMLGDFLYQQGREEEAEPYLLEAIEINPYHPHVHELLGLIALDVGRFDAARQSLELALRFDPRNEEVRQMLQEMPKESR